MFGLDITPLSAQVLGTALLIFGLRVTDVAMGTARTITILRDIVAILRRQWRTVATGEAMVPFERLARGAPQAELLAALRTMDDANVAQVPVIEEDEIVGILSREQVRHYIRLRSELGVGSVRGGGYATLQEHSCSR